MSAFKASKIWMDQFLNDNDIKFKTKTILFELGKLTPFDQDRYLEEK